MSFTLRSQIGGWGAVRNPLDPDEHLQLDTGELVVEDEELARALEAEYGALEIVDEPDETEPSTDSDEESGDELPADPSEMSVMDIHEWASSTDDPDTVESMLSAERDGKDRSSAIERLEQRLGAIQDEE